MTCGVVTLTFMLLTVMMSSLPFSPLYRLAHEKSELDDYAMRVNDERTDQAFAYLNTLPRRTGEELKALATPQGRGNDGENARFQFVVAVISVNRKHPTNTSRSVSESHVFVVTTRFLSFWIFFSLGRVGGDARF
jgi:hypothetical protein